MVTTIVWASRDVGKNKIKVWAEEPKFVEPNEVWTGKSYLGISCTTKWPGPHIDHGEAIKVAISATRVL